MDGLIQNTIIGREPNYILHTKKEYTLVHHAGLVGELLTELTTIFIPLKCSGFLIMFSFAVNATDNQILIHTWIHNFRSIGRDHI